MIKPLAKKHRFRRWLRRLFGIERKQEDWRRYLADIDEMHTFRPSGLGTRCPHCGAEIPLVTTKRITDGRTIAQTIIDEVPPTNYQKKAVERLKEVAPGYPEYTYQVAAVNLEAMSQSSSYGNLIVEIAKKLDDRATPYSPIEMSIKVVDEEEHSKIHQIHKS